MLWFIFLLSFFHFPSVFFPCFFQVSVGVSVWVSVGVNVWVSVAGVCSLHVPFVFLLNSFYFPSIAALPVCAALPVYIFLLFSF